MKRRIGLLTRCLDGGGIQRSLITLGEVFAERGFDVDLVVGDDRGPLRDACPPSLRLLVLPISSIAMSRAWLIAADPAGARAVWPLLLGPCPRMFRHLPGLVGYMREQRPAALIAAGTQSNLALILASRVARDGARIVVSERNAMSAVARIGRGGFRRAYPLVARRLFPEADGVVAVSRAVADDLVALEVAPPHRISTIYNPVMTRGLHALIEAPIDHPWLRDGQAPVVLGVGRLHWQKDFPTLLRAFARIAAVREARLVVLGEGDERAKLEAVSRSLGIAERVFLPGFVANPFPWMARAAVLAVSSLLEGFGRVLPEAMACGCPVVSVDCPGGPREILDNGRYGPLVPVGDDRALAEAVHATMVRPPDPDALRLRACSFSAETSADLYLDIALAGT